MPPTKTAATGRLRRGPAALCCMCLVSAAPRSASAFGIVETAHSVQDALPSLLRHSASLASSGTAVASASLTATAASLPNVDLFGLYRDSLSAHPLTTNVATGAALAVAGDAAAQSREPEGHVYDTRRAASFMAFDASYRAVQFNIFPWIVEHCTGQLFLGALSSVPALSLLLADKVDPYLFATLERSLANQLVVVPFLYYPLFFALTGAVQGLTVSGTIDRARETLLPLMKRNLLFWIPVQFIQFGYVEESLQIPFLCVAGLAWTVILSVKAGSAKNYCVTGMEDGCELPDNFFDEMEADYSASSSRAPPRSPVAPAAAVVEGKMEGKKAEDLVPDVVR